MLLKRRAPAAGAPYYGWYIAVTLAVTETISWGIIYYAFSVFLAPMEADLGWTRAELTAGFSLSLLVMGAMAFPVGAWIDQHGARMAMTIGSIAATVLVIAWSQVTTLPGFYAIWIGLGVCAALVLYEPAFNVIAQWFHQRRGAALAIITFSAGLASTIFLPLADALLHAYGWRTAVLILGVFLGALTIPLHALMLRRSPAALGLQPDGGALNPTRPVKPGGISLRAALHDRVFWLLVAGFGLASLSAGAIRVHFIPYLVDGGFDPSSAAVATGAIGIMQVVGRVFFAPLNQRFTSRIVIVGVFALQGLSLMVLLLGSAVPTVVGFIALFGAAQGSMTLIRASIIGDLYGISHYGRISSVMAVCLTLTGTLAPLGASLVYDYANSYQPVVWIVCILGVLATAVIVIAQRQMPGAPVIERLAGEAAD